MRWLLTTPETEFSSWSPLSIGSYLPNVSLPTLEPSGAIHGDGWSVLPLTDSPPTVPDGKKVATRIFTVKDGKATAVYTLADMTAAEKAEQDRIRNPVPDSITDRQFFHALALNGEITQDEALEAVGTGTIPAKMAALVAKMPANAQFTAKMMLRGAQTFRRDDATTETIRQLYGWTHAQVDDLWRQAAAL